VSPAGKRGRPPLKKKDRRIGMQIYMTAAQHKAITEAAAKAGARYRTAWAEDIIVRELDRLAAE
jgi:molybdenum-dependent DNA-binding transcriptional regulator ModE